MTKPRQRYSKKESHQKLSTLILSNSSSHCYILAQETGQKETTVNIKTKDKIQGAGLAQLVEHITLDLRGLSSSAKLDRYRNYLKVKPLGVPGWLSELKPLPWLRS